MKAKIISFVDSPENSFPGSDGSQVKATALTIDVNGQPQTYITFAQKMEVGEEIDYELKQDKMGNPRLKIIRPDFKKGGGKSPEMAKLELLGRACNQAAQLATVNGIFNATEADKILFWIKTKLNATQIQKAEQALQAPVQQPQVTGQLHPNAPEQGNIPSEHDSQLPF